MNFNVGLKSLLHQGLSEPEFDGDLVYKFRKIMGRTDFSDQFRKIIIRQKRIGYDLNIMRQSACLPINPATVDNFAALFNRTCLSTQLAQPIKNRCCSFQPPLPTAQNMCSALVT